MGHKEYLNEPIMAANKRCKWAYLCFGRVSTTLELDSSVSICRMLSSVLVGSPAVYRGTNFDAQRRVVNSILAAATSELDLKQF